MHQGLEPDSHMVLPPTESHLPGAGSSQLPVPASPRTLNLTQAPHPGSAQ